MVCSVRCSETSASCDSNLKEGDKLQSASIRGDLRSGPGSPRMPVCQRPEGGGCSGVPYTFISTSPSHFNTHHQMKGLCNGRTAKHF